VSSPAHGDAEILLASLLDGRHDVVGRGAARDYVRLTPVHRVENGARSGALARLDRSGHGLSSL
jgi:hypothetical protein